MFRRLKSFDSGTSMLEFLIVLPVFILLLFGILEFSLIYRAKFTLNNAAQQVARAGSLNNACMSAMDDQIVRSLKPLFIKESSNLASDLLTKSFKASTIKFYSDVDIISPTPGIFNAFRERIPIYPSQISNCAEKSYGIKPFKKFEIIPNDNLQHRSNRPKSIRINGSNQKINIQDANLLKIQVRYCHRLYFPIIDLILDSIQSSTFLSIEETIFYNNCINGKGDDFLNPKNARFVILSAHAIARMQTPIFKKSLEEN